MQISLFQSIAYIFVTIASLGFLAHDMGYDVALASDVSSYRVTEYGIKRVVADSSEVKLTKSAHFKTDGLSSESTKKSCLGRQLTNTKVAFSKRKR